MPFALLHSTNRTDRDTQGFAVSPCMKGVILRLPLDHIPSSAALNPHLATGRGPYSQPLPLG